jgi:NADPH:quinone reductase-like Zn-dependent oxidoreductase
VADTEPFDRVARRDVDIVLDIDFDSHARRRSRTWLAWLRPGGMLIAPLTTAACAPDRIDHDGVHLTRIMAEPDHVALQQLAHLVSTGQLSLPVDRVLPLDQAAEAHQLGEADGSGKAILTII